MIRVAVAAALLLSGCGGASEAGSSITVYAAASLRDAFEELGVAYADPTGVDVILSFDASSTLRAQIEEGAPADVFASADLVNGQALVEAGLTEGPSQTFAGNALAIVVPADNPGGIDLWSTIARPGLRIIAAGEDVPISAYADELVDNLAALPEGGTSFRVGYDLNVVSREDNVRAVLAKIEIGEGDAAIVYETDARSSPDVQALAIPEEANVIAEYAVVALADSDSGASDFVTWLLGDEAQAILAGHGFRPPS